MTLDGLQDGTLCNEAGGLDEERFEMAMRHQLRQFAGRRISDFLYHGRAGDAERAKAQPPYPAPSSHEALHHMRTFNHHAIMC